MTTTTSNPLTAPPHVDQARRQSTALVAGHLGHFLADHRFGGDAAMIADTLDHMDDLGIANAELSATQHVTRTEIIGLVLGRIRRDPVHDSEHAQAVRAATAVLPQCYGDTMVVRGWLAGEHIIVDDESFELTGRPCRACGVAPQAHGVGGGGVRCADQTVCRHWSCL